MQAVGCEQSLEEAANKKAMKEGIECKDLTTIHIVQIQVFGSNIIPGMN